MMKRFLVLFLLFAVCGMGLANEDLRVADSCYAARAERAKGDKADAKNAKMMIEHYLKAMGDSSVWERATEGYVKSLFFSFRFVHFEKNQRKAKLDSLKAISETAYQQFPKNKEIAPVYASALSMWGNERGALTSVKDGVAAKVRDVATAAEDYQVLGRAHFVLPYVPLILSWPDKKLADKYLNMALQKNPRDLYNYFFLAELRFDQKRYADALDLIDRGLSRGIRTNYFLEDKRGRWELKELQKKINAKLDKK
jgi:tetratricopeptide (TPR) repeat protein